MLFTGRFVEAVGARPDRIADIMTSLSSSFLVVEDVIAWHGVTIRITELEDRAPRTLKRPLPAFNSIPDSDGYVAVVTIRSWSVLWPQETKLRWRCFGHPFVAGF